MDEKHDRDDVSTPSADGEAESNANPAEAQAASRHRMRFIEARRGGDSSAGTSSSSLVESIRRALGGVVAHDSPRRVRPSPYSSSAWRGGVWSGQHGTVGDRDGEHKNVSASETNSESSASTEGSNSNSGCFTMEHAISTGSIEQVSEFLARLHKSSAAKQLTGCYGGRAVGKRRCTDDNGLFRMTVPLLHTAYTGNAGIFSIVYRAMRDKLRTHQVKRAIAARDEGSRSILAMAAASKSKGMVETVLAALEERLAGDEVKEVMMAGFGDKENTILHWAAASGSKDVFEATLAALESYLTRDELKGLMTYSERRPGLMIDSDRRFDVDESMMKSAAIGGDKETWSAVLAQLERLMSKVEVKHMLAGRDEKKGTVINAAIRSGSIGAFTAVLDDMNRLLTPQQRKEVLTHKAAGLNILHTAAESGNTGMFRTAIASLWQELAPGEVHELVNHQEAGGRNILHYAAGSGNREMFLDVLETVDEHQVVEMMLPSSGNDVVVSVLHSAAGSASKETFEAVLAGMEDKLTLFQVQSTIRSTGSLNTLHLGLVDELGDHRSTILHSAAYSGSKEVVRAVVAAFGKYLTRLEVKAMMTFTGCQGFGRSVLHSAADSGSSAAVKAVFAVLGEKLTPQEVKSMITLDGEEGPFGRQSILHLAVTKGSKRAFKASLAASAGGVSTLEVKRLLIATAKREKGLLKCAAKTGSVELWEVVIRETGHELLFSAEEAQDLLVLAASGGCADMGAFVVEKAMGALGARLLDMEPTLVLKAIDSRDPTTVELFYTFLRKTFPAEKTGDKAFSKTVAAGFSRWAEHVLGASTVGLTPIGAGGLGWAIEVLACLLQYPAELEPKDLEELSRNASSDWLGICFLETMASVENPFVAGMTLSVALAKAAVLAPQGERRKLLSLQKKVDALLLEILERLPQTVHAFRGGMAGCSAVFEPEVKRDDARGLLGPLPMICQGRGHMETFCTRPLIVDFLWRRFTHGIPDLLDTKGVLDDAEEIEMLAGGSIVSNEYYLLTEEHKKIEDDLRLANSLGIEFKDRLAWKEPIQGRAGIFGALLSPCIMLQGVDLKDFSMTSLSVLPGAQFILAGLAAMPDAFYRVPAMRMALDLLAYLGMVSVFSSVVLFHDTGPPTKHEFAFAFYILAGAMTEVREMKRSFRLYKMDYWNPIDFLGFGLVAAGLVARFVEGSSLWGRILYALGAPLIFSRVLFFAQMLRFQGPMVQVIFSVMWDLVEFGVMIVVIMLGFAMSFHALFRDTDTFGQTLLTLFKGALGEVEYFDDFRSGRYDDEYEEVATALFIAYLVVITIALLNLLIAVLSKSLVKVQDKADQEFRVSRARLIDHYRLVVDKHLLPAPFNVVQAVLALPFWLADRSWHGIRCTRAKEVIGRVVFWLVLGLVAVLGGTALWVVSVLYAPFSWCRHRGRLGGKTSPVSNTFQCLAVMVWCVVGAPLYLVAFWMTAPFKWVGLRPWSWIWDPRELNALHPSPTYVDDVLIDRPGGLSAGELQECLEDPMNDPQVRQDEKSRFTTVEHMKLLRDRLEATIEARLGARMAELEGQVAASQVKLDKLLTSMQELTTAANAKTADSK